MKTVPNALANFLSSVCVTLLLGVCAGCETVSSTAEYYRPLTTQIYPPKPDSYKVTIFGAPPKRNYEVIGRLTFNDDNGYDFMIKAIEYNARQAGADAAIMLYSSNSLEQYTYTVPGHTTHEAVTTYSSGSSYGNANLNGSDGYSGTANFNEDSFGTSTTYVPVNHPAHNEVGTRMRYYIDAEMIVFK
jgi:hypothetical protein